MLAAAEGRGVMVVNGSQETIRTISISPAGSGSTGENRLRSQLPPGTQAHIAYSTGCRADVRLGFASGRTEEFLDQDTCSDLRVVAGQGAAGPAAQHAADKASGRKGKPAVPPVAAKVVVPPWTGHSILKKFGGLD